MYASLKPASTRITTPMTMRAIVLASDPVLLISQLVRLMYKLLELTAILTEIKSKEQTNYTHDDCKETNKVCLRYMLSKRTSFVRVEIEEDEED